jgi:hypothetical protein
MSQYYLNIFADLLETTPGTPFVMPDPYDDTKNLEQNIKFFYKSIRNNSRTNDHLGALINAYYLGYLLEERAEVSSERRIC